MVDSFVVYLVSLYPVIVCGLNARTGSTNMFGNAFWLPLLLVWNVVCARLYENKTTAVVELSSATFTSIVQNDTSSTQWVITYYAHWCGHCQHFAPEFIKIAETFRPQDGVKFGAIDCADEAEASLGNADICKHHDIRAYPTVLLYQRGERKSELAKSPAELLADVKKLVDHLPSGIDAAMAEGTTIVHAHSAAPSALSSDSFAMIQDAELTLFRLLRNEVFKGNSETLSAEEMRDLETLLSLCGDMLLPAPARSACTNLTAEVTALRTIGQKLTRRAWLALLESEFDPPKHYLTCKDFSCGMWRFLHLLTLSGDSEFGLSAKKTMELTRFVVGKYFSCEVCRNHFLGHYDACDFGRCSMPVDVVNVAAWLSRLHNGVNARLGKTMWPTGHVVFDALDTFNQLRIQYGMSTVSPPLLTRPVFWLVLVLAVVGAVGSVRLVSGRSTLLNRLKFTLTKKYHPIDIV